MEIDVSKFDTLSFSGVEQYLGCGEQWRRVNVDKLPQKPSFAMDEGTAHHLALATNNLSKRDKGRTIKMARMVDVFANSIENLSKESTKAVPKKVYFADESVDVAVKRAKAFYPQYMRKFDPEIEPDWIEQPFIKEVTVGGMTFKLRGVIDLTTKKKKLRDYKTSSSVKSQAEVDSSVQLSLYSGTTNLRDVGFIDFVKTKNPYVAEIKSTRSPAQVAWGMMVAQRVLQGIQAGVFPLANPSPQNWRCSEKFCGFWKDCRGKYEAVSQLKIKE